MLSATRRHCRYRGCTKFVPTAPTVPGTNPQSQFVSVRNSTQIADSSTLPPSHARAYRRDPFILVVLYYLLYVHAHGGYRLSTPPARCTDKSVACGLSEHSLRSRPIVLAPTLSVTLMPSNRNGLLAQGKWVALTRRRAVRGTITIRSASPVHNSGTMYRALQARQWYYALIVVSASCSLPVLTGTGYGDRQYEEVHL